MDLTAAAVEQKTFDTIKRDGFDPKQVSAFLADVAAELAHMRGELAKERSRSRTLELSLEEAKTSSRQDTDAFLAVSDAKQRVMEAAERRVLALLASAHTAAGHDNPEELAQEDLASILEEAEAGPSVLPDAQPVVAAGPEAAVPPAGGIFGPAMGDAGEGTERALAGAHMLLAEALRVPSLGQTEAAAAVVAARDEAERVRLHAKLIHARAEVRAQHIVADAERAASRLEVQAAENAADIHQQAQQELGAALAEVERIRAIAETEKAEVVKVGEAEAAALMAEAVALMDEARDLPERFSSEAEALVTEARQQAENIRMSAWEEAEQAQEAADAALQEALREAQEVRRQTADAVDDAEAYASELRAQADADAAELLATAGAQLEAAEADLAEVQRAAREGISEAERESNAIVADAQQRVEELGSEIADLERTRDRDAAQVLEDAQREAGLVVDAAEQRIDELAKEIAELESERDRVAALTAERAQSESAEARAMVLEEVEAAEAEISELLATAQADAASMRAAASDEGAGILEEARAEARRVIDDARTEAEHALLGARSEHQDLVSRLRSMKIIIEELQQRLPDLAMRDGDDADIVVLLDDAGAAAIDLRHRLDGIDDDWDGDMEPMRASRYSKRSAGLPSMGREESEKAIGGMANLRAVESQKSGRRRGGRSKGQRVDIPEDDEETA